MIDGTLVRVFLLVAVLSYSRRLFVKAFLSERQDDWREGVAAAFAYFGDVPRSSSGITRAHWSAGAIATRARCPFIRDIWLSAATGTCSRERARPIARGPKARRSFPRREQRLRRRVAHDAFVDVNTVRDSVPPRLIRDHVDVVIEEHGVRILHGTTIVATHRRCAEPLARVIDPTHFVGLWRSAAKARPAGQLAALGRDLADYAPIIGGAIR